MFLVVLGCRISDCRMIVSKSSISQTVGSTTLLCWLYVRLTGVRQVSTAATEGHSRPSDLTGEGSVPAIRLQASKIQLSASV